MSTFSKGAKRKRSNKARGTDLEKRAQRIFEARGYLVHRAVRTSGNFRAGRFRGGQNNDVFGVFDLIAIKPGAPIKLVQVTTKAEMRKRERKVQPVALRVPMECADVLVYGFVGGRRPSGQMFRVTVWNGLEWAQCPDVGCIPAEKKAKAATPRPSARTAPSPNQQQPATQS